MQNSTLLNLDAALQCPVFDQTGATHIFSEVLKDGQPYLISLIRHFGCIACAEHITSILKYKKQITDLGIKLVIIGNGNDVQLAEFIKRMRLIDDDLIVVTDPTLLIFKELGLEYSITSTIHYKSLQGAVRAYKAGHRNQDTKNGERGSHFQQGGILMLDSDQNIEYYFRSEHLGDKPSGAELLEYAQDIF